MNRPTRLAFCFVTIAMLSAMSRAQSRPQRHLRCVHRSCQPNVYTWGQRFNDLLFLCPQKWWVRCTNAYCRRYLVIGTRFLAMGSGCHGPDMVLPPKDHSFPACELGEYSSGGNANEVVEGPDTECTNDPKP
jgi:hypothetical protein